MNTLINATAIILVIVFPFACNGAEACAPEQVLGTVTRVVDGDTIHLDRIPVRLQGLAAPERDEPGGRAATEAMTDLALLQRVLCDLDGTSTHGRCVGTCYLAGTGQDLAETLVRAGLARDCPRFSGGGYAEAEALAQGSIRETYSLPGYCE